MRFLRIPILAAMVCALVYLIGNEVSASRPARIRVTETSNDSGSIASAGGFQKIDWSILRQLDPRSGAIPDLLRRLDSRRVAIPGYIVPLEDNAGYSSEFLIVPYFGACIHSPPPPPNQMVLVKMTAGRPIQPSSSPVWMHGVLWLVAGQSPYGKTSYQMSGSHIEPFQD